MSELAIRVDGLSKQFRIGSTEQYRTLRDTLTDAVAAPFRRLRNGAAKSDPETIWALKDVSFEVKRGEVIGIIGRNGAGKSTLLKILSRITGPTHGHAEIHGRVASLLEVGTGFHPELTGRENIFLNGAILGMKKAEILSKFDEIVAFAEVEKFIDTPVKHYSSGMYVRLAFAVAAHLDPEILIVDEVLAVGDAEFQRKCLGRMEASARQGRTVLFVSHNMPAVSNLCTRVVTLESGTVAFDGFVQDGLSKYLATPRTLSPTSLAQRRDRQGTQFANFAGVHCEELGGSPTLPRSGQDIVIVLKYASAHPSCVLRNVQIGIDINGRFDERLLNLATAWTSGDFDVIPAEGEIRCNIPRLPLLPGRYSLDLFMSVGYEMADFVRGAWILDVQEGNFYGCGRSPALGYFAAPHSWTAAPAPTHHQESYATL